MTPIIVAIALIGSLTARGMSRDTTNLPVRNGPQTQNPNLPFDPNQPNGEMINSPRTTSGVNNNGFIG
ncbi:hypothetical protein [Planktotalea sp.]|uniref:hypothetical protein n=1 Tax=Planktotalea sp. TaxID=2029877 RepID=UPI0035C7B8DC